MTDTKKTAAKKAPAKASTTTDAKTAAGSTDASSDGKGDPDPMAELKAEVAEIGKRLDEMEAAIKSLGTADGVTINVGEGHAPPSRDEVLKLHRRVEGLANHLNFPLPT